MTAQYIVAVLVICGLLAAVATRLPRKERNRLQAFAAWAAFALIYLGNVVAQQAA